MADQTSSRRQTPTDSQKLLVVSDLRIDLYVGRRYLTVMEDVSFSLSVGETLGLVGESGSGKTMTSLALMGLLPRRARIPTGSIHFQGRDLVGLSSKQLQEIRGRDIGMVFQDPMTSLNPAFTVGYQVTEAILAHEKTPKDKAFERAVELLDMVGIPAARKRANDYPHQFSGGMAQRALIAMAIACRPKLLIADEPVTALDVTIRAQILDLLKSLREQLGMSLILISHDLGVVAHMVDRVAVMYAGQIVEEAVTQAAFARPLHPYTEALLKSRPDASATGEHLPSIPGTVPRLGEMPAGCRFGPRCSYAAETCQNAAVALTRLPGRGDTRCNRLDSLQLQGAEIDLSSAHPSQLDVAEGDRASLVQVRGLSKYFPVQRGILRRVAGHTRAVDGIDLDIVPGETVGLVGETGSGKSTVARLLLRLIEPTAGTVRFDGCDLTSLDKTGLRELRRHMQMIFQNPYGSLNPMVPAGDSIGEPLETHLNMSSRERKKRIAELLECVGLDASFAPRFPRELSGGQCQRIAIARALALNPRLIVCDEPVSALDVSTQAQVINLLMDLQRQFGIAYLFISHDLSVVQHLSNRIAVMYLGRIVEIGDARNLYSAPQHPYTQALLSAVLLADPRIKQQRILLRTEDLPNPLNLPSGCRFHPRCPQSMELCREIDPPAVAASHGGLVSCHLCASLARVASASPSAS